MSLFNQEKDINFLYYVEPYFIIDSTIWKEARSKNIVPLYNVSLY